MTQHRHGLFRNGNRWCSAAELERLRREAADDGPEARKRLRRAERRCGLVSVYIASSAKSARAWDKGVDLVVDAVRRGATKPRPKKSGHHWKVSTVLNLRWDPPIYRYRIAAYGDPQYHKSDVKRVVSELKRALPAKTDITVDWMGSGATERIVIYVDPPPTGRKL